MRVLVTKSVKIPSDCTVTQNGKVFIFKGERGCVTQDCTQYSLTFDIHDGNIRVRLWNGNRKAAAIATTVESLLRNAVRASTHGFSYTMKAVYNHFSIGLEVKKDGKMLVVKNFLGEKKPRIFKMRGAAKAKLLSDRKDTFVIEGPSLPDVSQCAGTISNNCRPKNLDSRIFLDGIFVIEKGAML